MEVYYKNAASINQDYRGGKKLKTNDFNLVDSGK